MNPKKIFQISTQKYLVAGKGFIEDCLYRASDIEYFQASLIVKALGDDYNLCDKHDTVCYCLDCEDDC